MLIRGVVTAVELYDGVPYVTIGGSILPMSQVISVNQPRAQADTTEDDPSAASRLMAGALDLLNPIDELGSLASALNPLKLL